MDFRAWFDAGRHFARRSRGRWPEGATDAVRRAREAGERLAERAEAVRREVERRAEEEIERRQGGTAPADPTGRGVPSARIPLPPAPDGAPSTERPLPRSADPELPFLTLSEAARLRRLVRSAFAERGIECTVDGGHLVDASGNWYGLWNLATAVADLDRAEWREVIDNHVRITLSAPSLPDMEPGDVLAGLLPRLVDLDSVPFLDALPHVRALAPGLVEILTVDLPESVVTPPAAELTAVGPIDTLLDQARVNLVASLSADPPATRTIRADDGLTFDFAYGDSFYVASLALVLGEFLDAVAPGADRRKGVFVAVPNRHHLAYRVVTDLPSLMAVGPMAAFARNGYDDGAGPVSPHVYWVHDDVWVQLTVQDDASIAVHVPPELTALVEED